MSVAVTLSALVSDLTDVVVPDTVVAGLSLDNRTIQAGYVFVALRGTQQHGLMYANAAVNAGACAVLYEPEADLVVPNVSVPCIPVVDLRQHLGVIGARFEHDPSRELFMVGVTGTDGKTSVTHFIAEALNAQPVPQAAVIGTIGIGNPTQLQKATHTTPDALTVQRVLSNLRDTGFENVAMEVSSHALDQGRVNAVKFDVAVLTNLTRDHLDYHGTVEAYAAAKYKLFQWDGLKTAVLNLDDAFGQKIALDLQHTSVEVIGYGVGNLHDYPVNTLIATDARFNHTGIQAMVHWNGEQGELQAPVLGRFNLHNLLAALGVLLAKGLTLLDGLQRLQHVWVVSGRMEKVTSPYATDKLVVVDYAHTPAALGQVLNAARAHTAQRLICVFGCGGDRDRGKRPVMAQMAESLADVVIVTDDNPRTESPLQIFEDIKAGFKHLDSIQFEHDRAKAIRLAMAQARAGDTILIAGKGHETVQILATSTLPFDDRIQAALALEDLAK